jgi:hypothetical protein
MSSFLLVTALIVTAFCGGAYVATAWWVARRFGERWLVATCLIATLLLWACAVAAEPSPSGVSHFALLALSIVLGGVGLATLSVRRRLRGTGGGPLTVRATAAGVGAYLAGQLIGMIPLLARDVGVALRSLLGALST